MLSDRQNSILKQLLKNPNQALSIKDLLPSLLAKGGRSFNNLRFCANNRINFCFT